MKVLVIAAHPDDEVLGCAGTIARLAKAGHHVSIAVLGEGITSRNTEHGDDSLALSALRQTAEKVATFLGADQFYSFEFPDNRFDTVPMLDIIKKIESLIVELQPEIVFTQHGGDLNIDHVITFRSVLTATRPVKGHCVKSVYAYEVNSSSDWSFTQFQPRFHPNLFMDITHYLNMKIDAMQMYESESRSFPHPRSAEALTAQARRWGSMVAKEAAEAFQIIREVR